MSDLSASHPLSFMLTLDLIRLLSNVCTTLILTLSLIFFFFSPTLTYLDNEVANRDQTTAVPFLQVL